MDKDALGNSLNYDIYRTHLLKTADIPSPPVESGRCRVTSHGLSSGLSLGDGADKCGSIARPNGA
jgi:hypothetical protein